MLLLAVRTRQPDLRRRAKAPTAGMPGGPQTGVPFAAAFYGSIVSSPSAQRAVDFPTTNADMFRSATTDYLSIVTARSHNSAAASISGSFLDDTGFNVGAHPSTQEIFDIHLVILVHLAQDWGFITPWIAALRWSSSFQPSACVPTFGLRTSPDLGRMGSERVPIMTHMPTTSVVGVVRVGSMFVFIPSPLFIDDLGPRKAVGTKIGARMVPVLTLEGTSG